MKSTIRLLLTAVCAFSLHAAHAATIAQDTQELRLQGHIDPTTPSGDEISLHASYGYFFLENIQAGGRFGFLDNDDATAFDIGAYLEYNVDTGGEVMPFGEVFVGMANVDVAGSGANNSAGIIELRAGAKYFLAEQLALAFAGVFAYATDEVYPDKAKLRDNDAFIEMSLRFYF